VSNKPAILVREMKLNVWVNAIVVVANEHAFAVTGRFSVQCKRHCIKDCGFARPGGANN
jgi:hypothetical protein